MLLPLLLPGVSCPGLFCAESRVCCCCRCRRYCWLCHRRCRSGLCVCVFVDRRLPQGRIIYGFELVANGFKRPQDRHDPNGAAVQCANGAVFETTWKELPIQRSDECAAGA